MPFLLFVPQRNDCDHSTRLAGYLSSLNINQWERH